MSLELITGPMFAGKSCELMRRIRMLKVLGKKYMVIKPTIDNRYDDNNIVSHNFDKEECIKLNNLYDIYTVCNYNITETIFIDEAQFFDDLKSTILQLVEKDGKNVIVSGLIGDYNRQKFGQILDLIPYCDMDKITFLSALCLNCKDGTPGIFSHRNKVSNDIILIGESDIYSSVCRKHYLELK